MEASGAGQVFSRARCDGAGRFAAEVNMASSFSGSLIRLPFLGMLFVLMMSSACKEREVPFLVVHVLRDPSAAFAKNLRQADWQFALTKPHLNRGKGVMIATNEGNSYLILLRRLSDTHQELLILNSRSDLADNVAVRNSVGKPQLVCGGAPAYVPDWVSGEAREASEMYLQFLVAHCEASKLP